MRFRGVNGLRFHVSWSPRCCLGLAESRCVKVVHVEHCTGKFAHTVMYVYYR